MTKERAVESRVEVVLGTESEPVLIRFATGERPGTYGSNDSYALRSEAGWILIDPQRPTAEALDQLRGLIRERPVATVLTSDGHERSSFEAREAWGTPVWGPALGEAQRDPAYEGTPDHLYKEGDELPGGLRAIKLAGAWRGDHALLWRAPAGERVLLSGDILVGQVERDLAAPDHFRGEPGLYFGARPGYVERHADPAALKASLERLLSQAEFDLICGAHGKPFRDQPRVAVMRLIESIQVRHVGSS